MAAALAYAAGAGMIFSWLFVPLSALAQSACKSPLGGYCVNLATVYPGIEFLGDINGVGGILVKLFNWGLGVAALCAFAMITFGGIEYVTAGDNQGRATDAKKRILQAIFGLTLALTSWLILFTINPDLTKGWTVNMPKLELKGGNDGGPSPQYFCARVDAASSPPVTVCGGSSSSAANCNGACSGFYNECVPEAQCN